MEVEERVLSGRMFGVAGEEDGERISSWRSKYRSVTAMLYCKHEIACRLYDLL